MVKKNFFSCMQVLLNEICVFLYRKSYAKDSFISTFSNRPDCYSTQYNITICTNIYIHYILQYMYNAHMSGSGSWMISNCLVVRQLDLSSHRLMLFLQDFWHSLCCLVTSLGELVFGWKCWCMR